MGASNSMMPVSYTHLVNDTVEVISGNFKGVRGTVQRVYPGKQMVVVSGVNIVKKHQKSRPTGGRSRAQGGIIEFEAPIHVSKAVSYTHLDVYKRQ